jgi:PAS domain S-box-containing protein
MTEQLQETLLGLEQRVSERTAELSAAFGEVARQKQYFETLVEISPVAVVTMDRDERVSGWNPAATRLFGYLPEEAIGRDIDALILADPELRAEGHDLAQRLLTEGGTHVITRRTRKHGGVVDVEITGVPLIVDGQHIGSYAIYHDISDLQQARREADAANQAKSTFLAAMSHEIRTPMNAIIGMSGLLLDTPLDEEQRDFADTIRTSGDALLTIINDILDFSKIEAGRFELDAQPFGLGAVMEGALDVLAPQAQKKGLEVAYAIEPGLPPALIGDAGRLRQIVLNLLSNAVKFTERGEIALRVAGRRLDPVRPSPGRWEIAISVKDSGIGIPPDRMDRLFQSFSQVDVSIARRYGGTGLGLAISRRLAELMDGSLTVESAGIPGQGSTFTLRFQAVVSDLLPDTTPIRATDGAEALEGKRVLVVDDNDTNRRIVLAQIGAWGMVGRDSASPIEALDWVKAGDAFDLVLLDLNMPDLDGLRLAQAIKEVRPTDLPLVLLSSVGHREKDTDLIAASLSKPIKPSTLHDALVSVLAGAKPGGETVVRKPDRPMLDAGMAERLPLRILLAEDNLVNQKLAVRLLAQMGYTVDIADNGLDAIAALDGAPADAPYDVVLMDVQMPELDGLEATRRIRAARPDGTPRIIAMTANAMAEDREACRAAGMDDYVSKPIRNEDLVAALTRAGEMVRDG